MALKMVLHAKSVEAEQAAFLPKNLYYLPRMNSKQPACCLLVLLSCFLASCSYSPIKTFGTYNYGARQMAIGVENSPKDSMVIETKEVESTETDSSQEACKKGDNLQSKIENDQIEAPQFSEEIKKLQGENELLKQEIQNLRMQMSQLPAQITPQQATPLPAQAASSTQTEEKQTTGYWLTSSSRKRHNSSCRYYQKSSGKPCGAEDGIPCKLCGG